MHHLQLENMQVEDVNLSREETSLAFIPVLFIYAQGNNCVLSLFCFQCCWKGSILSLVRNEDFKSCPFQRVSLSETILSLGTLGKTVPGGAK